MLQYTPTYIAIHKNEKYKTNTFEKKPTNLTLLITFTMPYGTDCFIQQCNNRCYLSKYPLQEAS